MSIHPAALLRSLRHSLFLFTERCNDWRYGVETTATFRPPDLGANAEHCHGYSPTSYKRFRQSLTHVRIRPGTDVFLDFGSGLGRAVVVAATYPFRRVIGVELSADLHQKASRNLARARPRLRCQEVELHNVDARSFGIPDDVTVVYFWSPFGTEILRTVLENIQRSVLRAPREVTILYIYAPGLGCLEPLKAQLPWLNIREEIPLGGHLNLTVANVAALP